MHAVTTVLLAFTAIVQAQPHGVRVTDSTPHALSITSSAVPSACVNVSDWLNRGAPILFLLLWSGGYTVAKIGVSDADPLTLLSIRYAAVLVLLGPVWLFLRPPLPASPRAWFDLALVGFLIQVVYFGCAWTAMHTGSSAGTVALITSLHPVLVALIMPMISAERVSARRWLGLVLGFAGAALVLGGNLGVQPLALSGVVLSCLALLAFTTSTLWEKRHGVAYHPLTSNLVQYLVGLGCTLPLAALLEPMQVTWTRSLGWALAYLVIGNSILAISLLLMMIRNGEATRVSALFFLVPPVSALIAWLLIDEAMTPLAWFGMAIAASGVWLATRQAAPRVPSATRQEQNT